MKAVFGYLSSVLFVLSAQAQSGIALGDLVLGGNACRLAGVGPIDVHVEHGILQIPAASLVKKAAGTTMARGTCNFSLPIRVADGYRLVIRDLEAVGEVNLARGTTAKTQLEIFGAGSQGDIAKRTDGSSLKAVRKTIRLRQDGDLLVSDCGGSLTLRGNSVVLLQGKSRGSAGLHLIELGVEVERCN